MTKASVTKLHEAEAGDDLPMPGIDIGIMANVGEQTQLQLKTMIAADTPDEIVNGVLDRMAGFAERMSAKSQILNFQAERTKFRDELSQMSADMAESERVYQLARAKAEEAIAECGRQAEAIEIDGRADHAARGRGGEYQPAGATLTKIKRAQEAKRGYANSIQQLDAERKQAIDQMTIAMRRRQERVDFLDAEILRLRKLIG